MTIYLQLTGKQKTYGLRDNLRPVRTLPRRRRQPDEGVYDKSKKFIHFFGYAARNPRIAQSVVNFSNGQSATDSVRSRKMQHNFPVDCHRFRIQ
jgi:hypothetical protein